MSRRVRGVTITPNAPALSLKTSVSMGQDHPQYTGVLIRHMLVTQISLLTQERNILPTIHQRIVACHSNDYKWTNVSLSVDNNRLAEHGSPT